MFKYLLPQVDDFFNIFEQHATITVQAAGKLLEILSKEDPFPLSDSDYFKNLEHQADEFTHSCVDALRKTFITPIDRDQIYNLISHMDDIVDNIYHVYECLVIYQIRGITPEAKNLAGVLFNAVEKVALAISALRNVKNIENIKEHLISIHRLENEGDQVLRRAIGLLFEKEPDIRLVIKWKEIYEILEEAIDTCEDVANTVEGIILESY